LSEDVRDATEPVVAYVELAAAVVRYELRVEVRVALVT
jgi:hypothetical protein